MNMIKVKQMREAVSSMSKFILTSRRFWGVAIVVAAFFMVGQYVDAERAQYGTIVRARGVVEYRAAGTTKWVTASERQRVAQGDRFKTGADGEAIIKLSNKNIISIKSGTEITINTSTTHSSLDENNKAFGLFPARTEVQDMEVGLEKGRAVNILRGLRGGSKFRLSTPVAVAGVRGTVFVAEILSGDESSRGQKQRALQPGEVRTNFICVEGGVDLSLMSGRTLDPIILNEGQQFSHTTKPGETPEGEGMRPIDKLLANAILADVIVIEKAADLGSGPIPQDAEPPKPNESHYN